MKSLLAALTLMATLIPASAFSAERDGTTIFFSFEDLRQEFAKSSLSQLAPIFTWRAQEENADRMTPIERNLRWGNGLGIDGYAHPGSRQPLWGY
jgi:hypothetical protein